jgi:hypothetical protein
MFPHDNRENACGKIGYRFAFECCFLHSYVGKVHEYRVHTRFNVCTPAGRYVNTWWTVDTQKTCITMRYVPVSERNGYVAFYALQTFLM